MAQPLCMSLSFLSFLSVFSPGLVLSALQS